MNRPREPLADPAAGVFKAVDRSTFDALCSIALDDFDSNAAEQIFGMLGWKWSVRLPQGKTYFAETPVAEEILQAAHQLLRDLWPAAQRGAHVAVSERGLKAEFFPKHEADGPMIELSLVALCSQACVNDLSAATNVVRLQPKS